MTVNSEDMGYCGFGGGIGFLAILFLLGIALLGRNGGLFGCCGNGWGNGCGNGCGAGNWGGHVGDGIGFGASSYGFQNFKATCDAEKSEIINTARTQYLVEQQASETRAAIKASNDAILAALNNQATQELRDKVSEQQNEIMLLKSQAHSDARFNTVMSEIQSINCNMLKQPRLYGVASTCQQVNTPNYYNGCGCNSCGCAA